MEEIIVNSHLAITPSEGFRPMNKEEIRQAYGYDADMFTFIDKKNHCILSLMWQKVNKVVLALAGLNAIARNNQKGMASAHAENHYELVDYVFDKVNGFRLAGYRYTYTLQGHPQASLCFAFKYKGYIYTLNCYKPNNGDMEFGEFQETINSLRKIK